MQVMYLHRKMEPFKKNGSIFILQHPKAPAPVNQPLTLKCVACTV